MPNRVLIGTYLVTTETRPSPWRLLPRVPPVPRAPLEATLDRMNLLASSTVISWARTRDVARYRYVCDFFLGCNDRPIDVTGPSAT